MKILYRNNNKENWQKVEKGKYKNEDHLQKILYDDPGLIPIADLGSGHKPLLVVVRELGLPRSGSTDIIGIDENGGISIIEAKLATNPDVKRTVIGQILEYAAFLWNKTYEEFDEMIARRLNRHLIDIMGERAENNEWSEEDFRSNVARALERGDFTLFIAVDEMNDSLKRILEFLNSRDMSNLEIYALSLPYFEQDGKEFLVPKIFGYSSIVKEKPKGIIWNEKGFFDQASKELDAKGVEILRNLYEFAKEAGEAGWGRGKTATFNLRVRKKEDLISVFNLGTKGMGWISVGHVATHCGKDMASWLANEIKGIGIFIPEGKDLGHSFPTFYPIKFSKDQLATFKNIISNLCGKIKNYAKTS